MASHSSVARALSEPKSPAWLPAVGIALFATGAIYWVLSDPMIRTDETAPTPAPIATVVQAAAPTAAVPTPQPTQQAEPVATAQKPAVPAPTGALRVVPKGQLDVLKKQPRK